MLAYADYTRPPVREKVHPIVVPQIAPITYSRAHPMTDDGEPNNKALRSLVEGWGKAVPATSYYFYGYYLAEVSAPNPMITKWGTDIPYRLPEGQLPVLAARDAAQLRDAACTPTTWASAWPGTRRRSRQAIVDELHEKFYGARRARRWPPTGTSSTTSG